MSGGPLLDVGGLGLTGGSQFVSPLLMTQQRLLHRVPVIQDSSTENDVRNFSLESPVVEGSPAHRYPLEDEFFVVEARNVAYCACFFVTTHRCAILSKPSERLIKCEEVVLGSEFRVLGCEIRLLPSEVRKKPSERRSESS